jgi:hypothetical protein
MTPTRVNRLELEAFHGHALRLGAQHGVPTPTIAAVYAGLIGTAMAPNRCGRSIMGFLALDANWPGDLGSIEGRLEAAEDRRSAWSRDVAEERL